MNVILRKKNRYTRVQNASVSKQTNEFPICRSTIYALKR